MEADAVGHQANDRGAGRHADVAEADDPGQARAGAEGVGAAARREYLGDDDRQAGPEAGEARDRDGRDPGCQRQPQASGRDYAADPDDGDDAKAVDEPVATPRPRVIVTENAEKPSAARPALAPRLSLR